MQSNSNATGTIEDIGRRDHEVTSEYRLYGSPGTGKTTSLTRQIRRAVDKFGADSVLVTSFSRAAAAELAGRDLPIAGDRVGTLHSHCYHALGAPEIAEANVEEWNRDNPEMAITPAKKHGKLEGEETGEEDDSGLAKDGDGFLQQVNRFRGMQLPERAWSPNLREFARLWTEYKQGNGLMDFTDLIETCMRDVALAPKNPSVIFADEAQDLNKLQLALIRKWGERAEYFIVAGDDDQASLPGSMVLTEGGISVPVEELQVGRHRLVSYDCVHSQVSGLRQGHEFRIEPSRYRGDAVRVAVANYSTRTTHNHPWLFRWTESSRDKHIVYLMRKGDSFRVGWCKLMRADGCSHLGVRAYQERADAAWILRICDTRSEASLWESYVAAEWGISTALWRPMHDQRGGHYTPEVIAKLFSMLGDHSDRAAHCLRAFGRDVSLPFYERGKSNRYGAQTNKTAACNLIREVMALPVVEGPGRDGVAWQPISKIDRFSYDGGVYGLSVPPHHTYIADGIVTHNCIYGFTGAQPEAILQPDIPEDHKIVLKQSYRVPRAVHTLAEKIIRQVTIRQEKVYLPRPEDGHVSKLVAGGCNSAEYGILKTAEEHVAQGRTVMFLASCSYMLKPLIHVLRKSGIPFHNPYRKSNGFWNPLRLGRRGSTPNRILALLVAHPIFGDYHRPWTQGDVSLWAEWLVSKGILRHGAKKSLQQAVCDREAGIEYLDMIFETGALESLMDAWEGDHRRLLSWWRERLTVDAVKRSEFPAGIAAKYGPQALMERPKIVAGTIHSVKGGQANVVFLFPDLSRAGDEQYQKMGAPRDSVVRLFYVGITRAGDTLYICQPESHRAVTI